MVKSVESVIHIDLDDKDEYINKYDDNKISDELHHYIIDSAMEFDSKRKIIIKIKMNFEVSEDEKEKLKRMLLNDFEESINTKEIKRKRDSVRDLYLIFIGISCIIVSFLFNYLHVDLVSELFLIIGWVPIWELVDNVLFKETEEKIKKRKYMQLKRADIVFE